MTAIEAARLVSLASKSIQAERLSEAEEICELLMRDAPASAAVLHLAARIAEKRGSIEGAVGLLERAVSISPDDAGLHSDLGFVLGRSGRIEDACSALLRASVLDPRLVGPWIHLGDLHMAMGRTPEAGEAYCRAVMLHPGDAQIFSRIGGDCRDPDQIDGLFRDCAERLAVEGIGAEGWFNLAFAAQIRGSLDLCVRAYQQTLSIDPSHFLARNNLGAAMRDAGDVDAAVDSFRMASDSEPDSATCHSNLLYMMHFQAGVDPVALRREHEQWNFRHAAHFAPRDRQYANDLSSNRRLRIGYVSPHLFQHPVGRFLLQLFANQGRQNVETFAYASVQDPDQITHRLQSAADHWIDALEMSDATLADRIRADQIDILVDLTMHMRGHRLLCFARKPAPIQVTYLAYCSTTGLDAIDYRLTDPYLDPPGARDQWYVEQSVRLPESYWCYDPGITTPEVNPLPALSRGYVTFASLNNFCKVSTEALLVWSRLLAQIPGSRLLLHAHRGAHRHRIHDLFARQGVAPERIVFVETLPLAEYFALYQLVDIALDSFPYAGGTTTCDALWMGVPVISLVGNTAVTRGGLSILSNVGLPQFAAHSPDQYIANAAQLAGDLQDLAQLRSVLRSRLSGSAVMNGPNFALNLVAAYRAMWENWVARRNSNDPGSSYQTG